MVTATVSHIHSRTTNNHIHTIWTADNPLNSAEIIVPVVCMVLGLGILLEAECAHTCEFIIININTRSIARWKSAKALSPTMCVCVRVWQIIIADYVFEWRKLQLFRCYTFAYQVYLFFFLFAWMWLNAYLPVRADDFNSKRIFSKHFQLQICDENKFSCFAVHQIDNKWKYFFSRPRPLEIHILTRNHVSCMDGWK